MLVSTGITQLLSDPIEIEQGVYICGTSHSYTLDDSPENYLIKRPENAELMIQIVHGMLVPTPFFGKYTLLTDVKTEADLLISGHYHPGFPSIEISDATIINIGSLGRNEKTNRIFPPSVMIIDIDEKEAKYEVLPLHVEQDVFIDILDNSSGIADNIDIFMQTLKDRIGHLEGYDVKSLIVKIGEEEGISPEIINKALTYIEQGS
jgi:exonuclease SbcD